MSKDDTPEIEITPDMRRALECAYRDWRSEHHHDQEVGLPGDVVDLYSRLSAALAKSSNS